MKKYLYAAGFALGLVVVTSFSVVNAALMRAGGDGPLPFLGAKAYAIGWLVSYLLSASAIGEFIVRKECRKVVGFPVATLAFAAFAFWACYRLHSYPLTTAFFGLAAATVGVTLYFQTKNARFSFAGALLNLFWYGLLTGECIALSVIKSL